MIRVVLRFFLALFRKKYFFGLEPPLGKPNLNKIFAQKLSKNTFELLFERRLGQFCILKKTII